MITALLVAQLVQLAAPPEGKELASPPAWCVEAAPRLEQARNRASPAAIEALLHALPAAVAARARDDMGRQGQLGAAVDGAATAIAIACTPGTEVDGDAALQVQQLLRDPRFDGVRTQDDFSDRLLERLWKWLEALFETEGMRLFADNTRAIYLTLLASVAAVFAVQLLRRSRRAAQEQTQGTDVTQQRQRIKAFAAWRAEALPLLNDEAQARRALLLLRAALLARVGEVVAASSPGSEGEDAVIPSRTTAEILLRLPACRDLIAPALHRFDVAFYGGQATRVAAQALLVDVDAAAAALEPR